MTATRALHGTAGRIPEGVPRFVSKAGNTWDYGGNIWNANQPQHWWPSRVGSRLSPCPPWSLCPQILERLNKMCGVGEQVRKKQQRLLKNMDAHKVMLDLLQIPYEKVGGQEPTGPERPGQRGHTGTPPGRPPGTPIPPSSARFSSIPSSGRCQDDGDPQVHPPVPAEVLCWQPGEPGPAAQTPQPVPDPGGKERAPRGG